MRSLLLFLSFIIAAASCAGGIETEKPEYTAVEENRVSRYGGGVIDAQERWNEMFNRVMGNEIVTSETVNDILWNTSLDKISFMPLADVDKLSGIIITEWYNINETEKIKLNIHIKNALMTKESLDVKIFQQSLLNDEWTQMDRNSEFEERIKTSILDTAKKIQLAAENL
tara:strand:- start:1907 stop:2416 length:510 start_codon:yes stop_codon:yes gene_type:complete